MKLEAKTLVELKQKFRKKMKWSDRRNWTDEEQKFFDSKYEFALDSQKSVFIVKEKELQRDQ